MAYYNIHGGGKGSVTFKKLNEFQEKLYVSRQIAFLLMHMHT